MILFESDWSRYPTAEPDLNTPNQSWVRIARLYRSMGIKNHTFPLALVNQNLKGVDPFDPYLTMEQILAIAYEVKINPWYYFREVARVPAISGVTRPFIRANRANLALYWLFFNHVFTILIQPRQTGKSLNIDQILTYLMMIQCTNTNISLLTKDDKLRRRNIARLKDIIACLPYYLNQTTKSDANNGEEVTVNRLGNKLNTFLPQASEIAALNAARGMTTAVFVIDEGPFQRNIKVSLPAALASMGAAVETAKENNEPYGVVMTTTSGKLDTESGAYVYSIVDGAATWSDHFLDCKDQEELHNVIRSSSRDGETLAVNATFSHRQLGYDDNWLRSRIKEAHAQGDDAARDFLNRWTAGREESPFSPENIERITGSMAEIAYNEIDPKYKFSINWYADKETLKRYMENNIIIIGMDTSEATGKDFIGLVFLCSRTGAVIGTSVINNILTYNLIGWLADLLIKYPNVILNPERKSTAVTIIDGLLEILPDKGIDPFKRIFNWIIQDPNSHVELHKEIQKPLYLRPKTVYEKSKRFFGYGTTATGEQSRDRLYGQTLTMAIDQFAERIHDATLIKQLMSLEIKNNRIDHANGRHDDLVIGWLLSFWVLFYGKNLKHYGIEPLEVLSIPVIKEKISKEKQRYLKEQKDLRSKAYKIAQLIANTKDPFINMKYERELSYLNDKIILEENEVFSIEELIRRAKEQKRQNDNWK